MKLLNGLGLKPDYCYDSVTISWSKNDSPIEPFPLALSKILDHQNSIAQLCQQNAVEHLKLFGSATTTQFDPEISDFDFLLEFATQDPNGAADRFFNLKQGLSDLIATTIDLIELRAIKNPFFLNEISSSRITIYGDPSKSAFLRYTD